MGSLRCKISVSFSVFLLSLSCKYVYTRLDSEWNILSDSITLAISERMCLKIFRLSYLVCSGMYGNCINKVQSLSKANMDLG